MHRFPNTRALTKASATLLALLMCVTDGPAAASVEDDAASTMTVDPTAGVESDTIVSDDPSTVEDVGLPTSFSAPGSQSFTWDASGAAVQYFAAAGTWWDGVCTSGEDRYTVIKQYTRPRDHSRMVGSYAKMYCGKIDRNSEPPVTEAAFGIRHIRAYHKSQFAKLATLQGSTWGHWMHWAIGWTVREPSRHTVQNADRFCYEKKFGFRNPNGSRFDRHVIAILGRTGQRIITSFPRRNGNYCQGTLL